MTILGTIRKNRSEIATEFTEAKHREVLSSMFAFTDNAMLVSYCPKKGKVVVLLSSMHTHYPTRDRRSAFRQKTTHDSGL